MSPDELSPVELAVAVTSPAERTYVVAVAGELDLYSTPRLATALEAISTDAPGVVLDLDGVGFLDSSGLGAILLAVRRLREAGGDMALVANAEATTKLLGMVGVDRVVPVFEATEQALAHLAGDARRHEQGGRARRP